MMQQSGYEYTNIDSQISDGADSTATPVIQAQVVLTW